jgi:hypothetical protein
VRGELKHQRFTAHIKWNGSSSPSSSNAQRCFSDRSSLRFSIPVAIPNKITDPPNAATVRPSMETAVRRVGGRGASEQSTAWRTSIIVHS